jgi:hypothetical protein
VLHQIAAVHARQGGPQESRDEMARSRELARKIRNAVIEGNALCGFAVALAQTGDFPGAARLCKEGREILAKSPAHIDPDHPGDMRDACASAGIPPFE